MRRVVAVSTSQGDLMVEIDDRSGSDLPEGEEYLSAAGTSPGDVLRVSNELDDVVRKSFALIHEGMRSLMPDEVEVEVGFKLTAKLKVLAWVLAETAGEASITAKCKWLKEKP